MKRLDFRTVVVVLLAAAAGCKGDPTADLRTGVSSISLNPDLMYIDQGSTKGLEVVARDQQLNPIATAVTVTSADPTIVTVAVDSSIPSADGAHFDYIVTAVGPGQTKLVATAAGVSDTASVTVLPTSFNGAFSSSTPAGGDTITISSTALLKFNVAHVTVKNSSGSTATILSKTADALSVLVPFGPPGPYTISGIVPTYVAGLEGTLPSTAVVTVTGNQWAASNSWQTAPNISALVPAVGGAAAHMTVAPASPNNKAVCPEFVLAFGSGGPCMMFRVDLADTATVAFTTDWDGTTATDIDVYVCADSTTANFGTACFEDGGAGATGAKPQTTGPTNTLSAGTHWFVVEVYAGTTANAYVTIHRP